MSAGIDREDELALEAERKRKARRRGRGPYRKSALHAKKRLALT
ncbi:MAG: hypothetical protein QXF24_07520 [Thermoproteota archaeon]